ncbi:MAG: hypothetical protein N3E49_00080 [Bacteroidia bacterium]|nr:hypothetical protein [Bacteroidia bacterium]
MKYHGISWACIVLILVGERIVWAQNSKVQDLLNQAGLQYTVDKDGDYKLIFRLRSGRTQVLFINSTVEVMAGESIIEIWSPSYLQPEIDEEMLKRLLLDSGGRKIGAWEVASSPRGKVAAFKVKLPLTSLTPSFLRAVCEGVVSTADEMENKLSPNSDDF